MKQLKIKSTPSAREHRTFEIFLNTLFTWCSGMKEHYRSKGTEVKTQKHQLIYAYLKSPTISLSLIVFQPHYFPTHISRPLHFYPPEMLFPWYVSIWLPTPPNFRYWVILARTPLSIENYPTLFPNSLPISFLILIFSPQHYRHIIYSVFYLFCLINFIYLFLCSKMSAP